MREHIPEAYDDHLITLEAIVRLRIKESNLCLKTLMGEGPTPAAGVALNAAQQAAQQQAQEPGEERRDTFQYSSKIPPKKLRCLNV